MPPSYAKKKNFGWTYTFNSHNVPRFSKLVPYKQQNRGGLGLPDLWLYYLAARWSQLAQWPVPKPKIPRVRFVSS